MRGITIAAALVTLCALVSSCDDTGTSVGYLGMWGQVDMDAESGTRFYERTEDLIDYNAGYSIEPGGYVVVVTSAYAGYDYPSRVEYLGTWELEAEDVLVLHYENYRGQYTVWIEIIELGNNEMTAFVSRTGPE